MKRLLTLTLILTLATAMVVAAQPPMRGIGGCDNPQFGHQGKHAGMSMGGRHRGDGIQGILALGDKLNLTDQQRGKLEDMGTKFRLQRVDERAALEKAQIELKALTRDNANPAKVNAAIDQVTKLKADMQKSRYAHRHEMQSVLTAEQKDQLKKLRQEFRGDRMGRPGCDKPRTGRGLNFDDEN